MSIKLTFEIVFHSDYHVTDGQRFGLAVDSALLRDHNQSPVLRGTALAGLLRDGFRDLQALVARSDIPNKPDLSSAETRLFGSAETPKAWLYSSTKALPEANGRWGSEDVYRVRINPRTRRAEPQKLFLQEKGNGRIRFTFTVACEEETDKSRADAALLVAAARMVRHLGSGRRRGQGQCEFNLADAQNFIAPPENATWQEAALDIFQTHWLEGQALPPAPEKTTTPVEPDEGAAKRFRLIARLAEPVIVAKKSEVANAFETHQIIPGTVLLGALANRVAKRTQISQNPLAHQQFVEMFFRGGISVTGLLSAQGTSVLFPSVPAPKAWAQCELYPRFARETAEEPHPLYDLSLADKEKCDECGNKLNPVTGFINLDGVERSYHEIKTREEIHTQMNRKTGRVNEGDLYTYEMIEAGQWFVGELRCAPGMWTQLQNSTELRANSAFTLRLGKATRRGYGLTHFYLEEVAEKEPIAWTEYALSERIPSQNAEEPRDLTMLFLTDAILTDDWGRSVHSVDQKMLAKLLKVDASHIKQMEAFVSSRSIDSFNTHRRMPRWRDEAIVAGSMVRFTLEGLTDEAVEEVLRSVETYGTGLRRQEGFGIVAFNHPVFLENPNMNGIPLGHAAAALAQLADITPDALQTATAIQDELRFTREWQTTLDDCWQEKQAMWDALTDKYEAFARLIYLYRYRPVTALLAWIDGENGRLGKETNLWGSRTLAGRDKQPKLEENVVKAVVDLLKQLTDKAQTEQTIGMTMLAERMGKQLKANRRRQGEQQEEVAHA